MNCDMIYDFYSVSCEFSLSPSLGEGIENTQEVRLKSYTITNHEGFFLSHP